MAYPNSPQMTQYSFAGVQLLPNHPFPYIQTTYATEGIELEECTVLVKDLCGTTLGNITNYFKTERTFNDPATGLPQVEWSVKNVPFDFGYRLVYLQIQTGVNAFIYSNPFMLTAERGEYVSRWDYRNKDTDTMMSTGIQLYFRQKKSEQDISNYTSVSSGQTFTATSRLASFERWNTDIIEIGIIEEFKRIFLCRFVFSLNANGTLPVRTGLFEAFESPDLEMDENFAEQEIMFTRNYRLTYDPNFIPVPTPPDPPPVPFITLQSLQSLNSNDVMYTYTYGNFVVNPLDFTFMWSTDGIVWQDGYTLPNSSPKTIYVYNHNDFGYFYSIYHNPTGTRSNVLNLPEIRINVKNMTSFDTSFKTIGNEYYIYFDLIGFTPTSSITYECSTDNINWGPVASVNNSASFGSPKQIRTPQSGVEFKYFRMRYNPLGITSNSYNFQF